MTVPTPNMPPANKECRVSGSLSDGSVCDVPPLTKVAFRRHQLETQTNCYNQNHMLPNNKNAIQSRKRFSSTSDKDQIGSSGYESATKKGRMEVDSPIIKTCNPVMENRVTSTNNDVVYKFSGKTPAEDFHVTYTLEERVKAAAFAIVYKNCRISTEKFETMFDKPAPDFKTIFAWRQRLLSTGCLVDSHLKDLEKPVTKCDKMTSTDKIIRRMPNPDEIIISDSNDDDSCTKNSSQSKHQPITVRQSSASAETLIIGGNDNEPKLAGSSISTGGGRASQARSNSSSTHQRTRSSSRDSQGSHYLESEPEQVDKTSSPQKSTKFINKQNHHPNRQSANDSDSDSVSYYSEEDNFLIRVFEKGRKLKRRPKRRPLKPASVSDTPPVYTPSYNTIKPIEQSPLVTGNIYTTNLHNMNVKNHDRLIYTDTCSSEYVPARLGFSTKNYQEFKDNVRRKGYWAKGNGATLGRNRNTINHLNTPTRAKNSALVEDPITNTYNTQPLGYQSVPPSLPPINKCDEDFSKNDLAFESGDQYLPFDKPPPLQSTPIQPAITQVNPIEKNVSSRIFDVVQSHSVLKNKSIMDIFNSNGDESQNSPERNDPNKYDHVQKTFETEWDEDDDALYKVDSPEVERQSTPVTNIGSNRSQSPDDDIPVSDQEIQPEVQEKPNKVIFDNKDKQNKLLDFLKNSQIINDQKDITDFSPTALNYVESQKDLFGDVETSYHYPKSLVDKSPCLKETLPDEIPIHISNEIISMAEVKFDHPQEREMSKTISPSKKVHVLESIIIHPGVDHNVLLSPQSNNNNCDYLSEIQLPPTSHQSENVNEYTASKVQDAKDIQPSNLNETVPNVASVPVDLVIPDMMATNPEPQNSQAQPAPQVDLTNLLSSINTSTLLLALQNLQQLGQTCTSTLSSAPEPANITQHNVSNDVEAQKSETINLTSGEEWEKESHCGGSIERELERLDGNVEDTPFLSDIFDPGPVMIPPNVAKKNNLIVTNSEDNKNETYKMHLNQNAPVIGNFKSFALPKPILLNRLKLTVKSTDKTSKSDSGKRLKRKKKVCIRLFFILQHI